MKQLIAKKTNKGVTLIALVVTIIVLIILAGVSIAILTGDNGIINNAKQAQKNQIEGEVKDRVNLAVLSAKMLAEKESTQNSSGFMAESNLKDNISNLTQSVIYNELSSELTNEYTIYVSSNGKTVTIYYTSEKYKSAVNDNKAGITTVITVNGNSFTVGTPTYNTKDNEFNASTAGTTASSGGSSTPTNPTDPTPTTYTVTYQKDTGVSETRQVSTGESLLTNAPSATKDGYTFVGWREDTIASSEVLTTKVAGTFDVTLNAVFEKEVTATFNVNGATSGTISPISATIYYNNGNIAGAEITMPSSNAIEKTDYTLTGFSIYGDANSTIYEPSSEVTITNSVEFIAQWDGPIIFDWNGSYSYTWTNDSNSAVNITVDIDVWGNSRYDQGLIVVSYSGGEPIRCCTGGRGSGTKHKYGF